MKKIYLFIGIAGLAYVTANEKLTGWAPDATFENVEDALEAVENSDYCLQLDRGLLDETNSAGGYSFTGDDFDLWTFDPSEN